MKIFSKCLIYSSMFYFGFCFKAFSASTCPDNMFQLFSKVNAKNNSLVICAAQPGGSESENFQTLFITEISGIEKKFMTKELSKSILTSHMSVYSYENGELDINKIMDVTISMNLNLSEEEINQGGGPSLGFGNPSVDLKISNSEILEDFSTSWTKFATMTENITDFSFCGSILKFYKDMIAIAVQKTYGRL